MGNLCIRIDDEDLEVLKSKADELRIPHTILARTLIVQGLKAGEVKHDHQSGQA